MSVPCDTVHGSDVVDLCFSIVVDLEVLHDDPLDAPFFHNENIKDEYSHGEWPAIEFLPKPWLSKD